MPEPVPIFGKIWKTGETPINPVSVDQVTGQQYYGSGYGTKNPMRDVTPPSATFKDAQGRLLIQNPLTGMLELAKEV